MSDVGTAARLRRTMTAGGALALVVIVIAGLVTISLTGSGETARPKAGTAPSTEAEDGTPLLVTTHTPVTKSTPILVNELTGTADWALELLAQLPISDVAAPVPYDRDDYDGWQDVDGDCQSTRHETLIAESVGDIGFTDSSDCKVARGSWNDPYTLVAIADVANASIDHVVSLSESHHAGAWAWSSEFKRALANDIDDPATLAVSATSVNGNKGARGPDEWLPDDPDARCLYLVARVRIKSRWHLKVSSTEHQALMAGLTRCVEQELPTEPETTPLVIVDFSTTVPTPRPAATPIITPGTCDTRYPVTCIPISAGDLDCVDIAQRDFEVAGSDPHNFDGDDNGLGCEVPSN